MSRRAIVRESGQKVSNFVTPSGQIIGRGLLAAGATEAARRRGRPPRDPLDALRARIWYWHVKIASGMTDYQLNQCFIRSRRVPMRGDIPSKAFERIRRVGVVPNDGDEPGLVEKVDQHVSGYGTAAVFRSDFWRLLRRPNMELRDLKRFIWDLSFLLGVARPNHMEVWGKECQKKVKFGLTRAYVDGVSLITGIGTLSSAALLGALYKEAVQFGETEIATLLKDGFISTMSKYAEELQRHAKELHIARFSEQLWRDSFELSDIAVRRVIFTASEVAAPGDYTEVRYPFSARR